MPFWQRGVEPTASPYCRCVQALRTCHWHNRRKQSLKSPLFCLKPAPQSRVTSINHTVWVVPVSNARRPYLTAPLSTVTPELGWLPPVPVPSRITAVLPTQPSPLVSLSVFLSVSCPVPCPPTNGLKRRARSSRTCSRPRCSSEPFRTRPP